MEWDGCNGDSSIILSDLRWCSRWIMMKAGRWESFHPSEGQRSDHRAGHYFEGWFLLSAKMSIWLKGSFFSFLFPDLLKCVEVKHSWPAPFVEFSRSCSRLLAGGSKWIALLRLLWGEFACFFKSRWRLVCLTVMWWVDHMTSASGGSIVCRNRSQWATDGRWSDQRQVNWSQLPCPAVTQWWF